MKTRTGIFLNVMILFLIIGDIQIPYYLFNPDALHTIYANIPSWYPLYVVLGLASNVAIIIGMWRLKKWAAYVLAAYFASKLLVDYIYVLPDKEIMVLVTTVVGAGLWFWAIRRKWNKFS